MALTASIAAFADANGGGRVSESVAAGSLNVNQGAVLCVAQINADGTVASGPASAVASASVGADGVFGAYEVLFKGACPNVQAAKGWARWVQVDTLQTGSVSGITCTTADRSGKANGIWVNCTDAAGASARTSFFLFVAR